MAELSRPTNSDDIIDSRRVVAAIEELKTEIEAETDEDTKADLEEELKHLQEFAEDADCGEWPHGLTLIRDDHFEDYARVYAESTGAVSRNATWPHDCIDWKRATRELQYGYSTAEFNGETYWYRNN